MLVSKVLSRWKEREGAGKPEAEQVKVMVVLSLVLNCWESVGMEMLGEAGRRETNLEGQEERINEVSLTIHRDRGGRGGVS